jgi:hypothetical protein
VLSRGRFWLKFWDLESGEVIHAREHELPILASSISRDGFARSDFLSFYLRD